MIGRIKSLMLVAVLAQPAGAYVNPHRGGHSAPSVDQTLARETLEAYFAAYEGKDLERALACWHADSPELPSVRSRLIAFFPIQQHRFSNLRITRTERNGDDFVARVLVDVVVTTKGASRPDKQQWAESVQLRQQNGVWRLWRQSSLIEPLLRRLRRLQTYEERLSLLEEDRELITTELGRAWEREAWTALAGQPLEAGVQWYRVMEWIGVQARSEQVVSGALLGIARLYEGSGRTTSAEEFYQTAIARLERAGLYGEQGDAELAAASSCLKRLAYRDAERHYQAAVDAFRRAQETPSMARAHYSFGTACYFEGDWDQAVSQYQKALALQEALSAQSGGDMGEWRTAVAASYRAIAAVEQARGDSEAAVKEYMESVRILLELGDASGAAAVEVEVARQYRRDGFLDESLSHYSQALELLAKSDAVSTAQVPAVMREIAEVYVLGRRYQVAAEQFERSVQASEKAGYDRDGVAAALAGLGGLHYLRGENDLALQFYTRSLKMREMSRDEAAVAWTTLNIGLVHSAGRADDEALASFHKSLELARRLKKGDWEATLLAVIGGVHLARGQFNLARDFATQACDLGSQVGNLGAQERGYLILGAVHRQGGRMRAAEDEINRAIHIVEQIRSEFAVARPDDILIDMDAPYLAKVSLMFDGKAFDEAFLLAERLKILALQQAVTLDAGRGLTQTEREAERRLVAQLRSQKRQLQWQSGRPNADSTTTSSLQKTIETAELKLSDYRASLLARYPALERQRARFEPVPLDTAKAVAPSSETAIIEYLVSAERTYVFVLAHDSFGAYAIEVRRTELSKEIARFREVLGQREAPTAEVGSHLYQVLMKPIEKQLVGRSHLIIVPDKVLWGLPFQALQRMEGHFLIQDFDVAYASSVTALDVLRAATQDSAAEDQRDTAVVFSELEVPDGALKTVSHAAGWPVEARTADARQEASAFSSAASAHVSVLRGRSATKDALFATRARFVYVAAPGAITDVSPLSSQIALASGSEVPDAGAMQVRELLGWDPRADVVWFTRLETAAPTTGEGLMAFSWALFWTGAQAVVLSDRSADGSATGRVNGALYRSLRRSPAGDAGRQAAKELRKAILPLLQSARYQHPYYWANLRVFTR